MVLSMTGFGRAEKTKQNKSVLVEIKSLNGKQFDLFLKIPPQLKNKELDIRSEIQQMLVRGTIECIITLKQNGTSKPVEINVSLLTDVYKQLKKVAHEQKADSLNLFGEVIKLPEIISTPTNGLSNDMYEQIQITFNTALKQTVAYRKKEGLSIKNDLQKQIQEIEKLQKKISVIAPKRKQRIKKNFQQEITQTLQAKNIDIQRLEQELIYYTEKIDINEEQVRLKQHCDYFLQVLNNQETVKGKKLGFILQEIGREINTLGSKAYDAQIQKYVVEMKDALEKAKEQVLNVL